MLSNVGIQRQKLYIVTTKFIVNWGTTEQSSQYNIIVCRLSLNIDARGEINWLILNVLFYR